MRKRGDRNDLYVVLARYIQDGDFNAIYRQLGTKRPPQAFVEALLKRAGVRRECVGEEARDELRAKIGSAAPSRPPRSAWPAGSGPYFASFSNIFGMRSMTSGERPAMISPPITLALSASFLPAGLS